MSTLITRVGGWPLSIVCDDDGAALAFIEGRDIPNGLRTIRVQPEGQTSTLVSAFVSDVVDWQDADLYDAQAHYQEHAGELAADVTSRILSGEDVDGAAEARAHMNTCARCGYWHRVMMQRLGKTRQSRVVPDLPTPTPAKEGWKTALFYKGSRVRDMGQPYWSDPDPEGQRVLLVHVEAYAPWGEVLCATAQASEVMLHPYHELPQ